MAAERDRVGLGWRGELAAGIFANLDRIDLVEVIADDYFHASKQARRSLRTLASQLPLTLHGVGMGLASTLPVQTRRLDQMARLIDEARPESWSEHLAFVRAGGIEIGHLAAPPRTEQCIEGAVRNIDAARAIIGSMPILENIATLVAPPASTLDEASWVAGILSGANGKLLLDLHNLYANAVNFGEKPEDLLLRLPLQRVEAVHLSGGHWISEPGNPGAQRLLDDHVHDVPPEVFNLLTLLAKHTCQPLTVIIERDGNYPVFDSLLVQIEAARTALRQGREQAQRSAV